MIHGYKMRNPYFADYAFRFTRGSMRALIQRVSQASVTIEGQTISKIGNGLLILLGIGHGDGEEQAAFLAEKVANLRIFEDEQGKTNLSVLDVKGETLVVSQFTLYADTRKGRRPSFIDAALPDVAAPLVMRFAELLRGHGVPTQTGQFGAHMLVEIHNDGPVTIWLEK
jgi:D-tyrosyl-tRNA(Tyr) deacylase